MACDSFLDELAAAIAKENKLKQEMAVKILQSREHLQQMNWWVYWVFKAEQQGSITSVEVDDGQGNWVEKATKEEQVEQVCMQENEEQIRQRNDMPFMRSPLLEDFGYLGIEPHAKEVLDGTYQPPWGTDKYAQMLVQQLWIPDHVQQGDQVPATITTRQYIEG